MTRTTVQDVIGYLQIHQQDEIRKATESAKPEDLASRITDIGVKYAHKIARVMEIGNQFESLMAAEGLAPILDQSSLDDFEFDPKTRARAEARQLTQDEWYGAVFTGIEAGTQLEAPRKVAPVAVSQPMQEPAPAATPQPLEQHVAQLAPESAAAIATQDAPNEIIIAQQVNPLMPELTSLNLADLCLKFISPSDATNKEIGYLNATMGNSAHYYNELTQPEIRQLATDVRRFVANGAVGKMRLVGPYVDKMELRGINASGEEITLLRKYKKALAGKSIPSSCNEREVETLSRLVLQHTAPFTEYRREGHRIRGLDRDKPGKYGAIVVVEGFMYEKIVMGKGFPRKQVVDDAKAVLTYHTKVLCPTVSRDILEQSGLFKMRQQLANFTQARKQSVGVRGAHGLLHQYQEGINALPESVQVDLRVAYARHQN